MKDKIAIIPSAWKPQNALFPGVFDPMIPINWKPTIEYILSSVMKLGFSDVIILLHKDDIKTYNYLRFKKSTINLVLKQIDTNNLSETILCTKDIIQNKEALIYLWDSIYTWDIDFSNNNILVQDKDITEPEKWCFVDKKWNFKNWPDSIDSEDKLIIGLYYLKKMDDFFHILKNNDFYEALSKYKELYTTVFSDVKNNYYDLWHLDEYYKSKIDFLRVRSFNSLEYDSFRWIITKKSTNWVKLSWEINWFNNIPSDLKIFTPRLLDYKLWNTVEYSLEFYGYNSIADIFLYANYPISYFKNILDKLLFYIDYVKNTYNNKSFPVSNIYSIYYDKTLERLSKLKENKFLFELYNKEYLIINWMKYDNIQHIFDNEKLYKIINDKIINENDFTIVHGDLCFSNILFDTFNWLFKLIDPRWMFWEVWVYGDIKYDIAKLRHSLHWRYENIISDLFSLDYNLDGANFNYEYFNWNNNDELIEYFDDKLIEMWYNIETIKFIEWLLYLTMIPLHSDSQERQIVMYLTSVELFNEVDF